MTRHVPQLLWLVMVGLGCHRAPAYGRPEPRDTVPTTKAPPPSPKTDPNKDPRLPESAAASDPYHPPPRDTVDVPLYKGWQQYSLQCARCHGEDAQGSSFGPSLLEALKPEGDVPTREEFLHVLGGARSDKGMPSAEKMGLDSSYFAGLYDYLKGRSEGQFHGGRPARRES